MFRYYLSILLLITTPLVYGAGGCWEDNDATPLGPIALNGEGEFVPQWAKTVVWYQIFPERFRNGDTGNEPTMASILGADPQEPPIHWQLHPWGSDWYELQDYERANGEPELWKHILRRRYGGDIQGILDKLDYLQQLGIGAIYLNPLFHSPSHHKYDGISYHHIDPYFGPDPEGDLALIAEEDPLDPESWVWTKADKLALKLIREAHKRNIRIIFDGVFNHLGINSFAFQDVLQNQSKSPYKDWFIIHGWRDEEKGTDFDYAGWFGVKSLPEFKEDDNGLVNGPRDYIFAATSRWMNPMGKGNQHGIDGWRLDVAYCVSHRFWKDWRLWVKSLNPDAYITAEIVAPPEKLVPFFQGDEFDAEMNYNFAFTAAEFFFNPEGKDRITATEFNNKLAELRDIYPKGVAYVTMNLFGSHDSNRLASHIVNRGIGNYRDWGSYFNTSIAMRNPDYQVRKPNAFERQLQRLFVLFQMTYVGAPMVYYGDEVGMWGGNDPSTRKPMLWPDISYDDERFNPDGSKRVGDEVSVDVELKSYYQSLIQLRNTQTALQLGTFKPIIMADQEGTYAFERAHKNQRIQVFLNNSATAKTYPLNQHKKMKFKVLWGAESTIDEQRTSLLLAPYTGVVIALDGDHDLLSPEQH